MDFASLGREKTALFLNISDTDRLANLFYTQALQSLCASADKDYPDHRLPVPVRFILDDFAANAEIPDFDKIISVSSLFPFTALTHFGLAITTRMSRFSRILKTGTQSFPVDSMHTSRHLFSCAGSKRHLIVLEKMILTLITILF